MRRVQARVARRGRALFLAYVIYGEIDELRLPQPRPARVADGLWQHTCCELFIASQGSSAYQEFNFSPSGEWAAYAFTDYRRGGPLAAPDPGIAVHVTGQRLELAAAVAPGFTGNLVLGVSAVIEHRDGTLAYWALRHPPGRPDFHHRDAFALELA